MAVVASRVNVAQVPILLARDTDGGGVAIRNRGANSVFLGGSNVTDATGYELGAGEPLGIDLNQEDIWAVATTGTNSVHILQAGA